MRKVVISSKAFADLVGARLWLTQPGSGQRARRKLAAINRGIKELKREPCGWPRIDETRRERVIIGYVAVYSVLPDTGDNRTAGDVTILRLYGPGQDRSGA